MMLRTILSIGLIAGPAAAQNCALRPDIANRLTEKYGEHLHGVGLMTQNGNPVALEIWVNDETDTFTVLMTYPTGTACMVAAGENYSDVAAPPHGDPM